MSLYVTISSHPFSIPAEQTMILLDKICLNNIAERFDTYAVDMM